MNPRTCTVRHNPPETYGDCVKACVASLIDRDDVPHVFDARPPEESWKALREYLLSVGFGLFITAYEGDPREYMKEQNPDIPYMMFHRNADGNHVVICKSDKIIHDPNWYRTAVEGPLEVGFYVVAVITHLS